MRCPFCQSDDTKVLDTRLLDDGSQVRRRRECTSCGERYSTRETVDLNLPRLIKSDNSRESFDEDKLRSGLLKALEKRPVKTSQIETSIQRIERKLMTQSERVSLWMRLPTFVLPLFIDSFKILKHSKMRLKS